MLGHVAVLAGAGRRRPRRRRPAHRGAAAQVTRLRPTLGPDRVVSRAVSWAHAVPHQDRRWCRRPMPCPGAPTRRCPSPTPTSSTATRCRARGRTGIADGRVRARAASGAPRSCSGRLPGVWSTAVGYAGGYTPNPTYEEVCSGRTGHAEVVLVVYDPAVVSYEQLLKAFWEDHDPTQGMRQGNDVGTQYRSAIYITDDEQASGRRGDAGRRYRRARCSDAGYGEITTEIAPLGDVLLRRAVPPAVPRQEPRRLLPAPRHRRQLPVGWLGRPDADAAAPARSCRRRQAARFVDKERSTSFVDKAKDVADDVAEKTGDIVDKVGEKIPDSVKDTAGDLKEKAGDLVDKVKDRLGFGDDDDAEDATEDAATSPTRRRRRRRAPPTTTPTDAIDVAGRRRRAAARAVGRGRSRRSAPSRWRGSSAPSASSGRPGQRSAPGVALSRAIRPCIGVPSTSTIVAAGRGSAGRRRCRPCPSPARPRRRRR